MMYRLCMAYVNFKQYLDVFSEAQSLQRRAERHVALNTWPDPETGNAYVQRLFLPSKQCVRFACLL